MTAVAEKQLTSAERCGDTTDFMTITDARNHRTSLSYSNNTTTSYAYDLASRLTGITHNAPSGVIEALTYQYDAAGNRTSLIRNNAAASLLPAAVASATYDAANEQTGFAGATLTYDANGNLTLDGVNTYQWDARNRLIGISGGATAAFNYDALGRRTSKIVNSTASTFLYDGNDIADEIGGAAVGATYLRSLMLDEPFIRQTSLGNEHYHTDALGSSLAVSNAQGSPVTTYGYEPFGKTTITGTSLNPFQFTGREHEGSVLSGGEGTGLYYYRARYYHTRLQRFIAEDPIGYLGGDLNFYGYVMNNPAKYTDPLGLFMDNLPMPGPASGALQIGTGAISVGAGVAHGAAATGLASGLAHGAAATAAAASSPQAFFFMVPHTAHVLAGIGSSALLGSILAGGGGYLIGQGVITIFPSTGTYWGNLLYNKLHPNPKKK